MTADPHAEHVAALAEERARALREAATEARVRGDIGPTEGYAS